MARERRSLIIPEAKLEDSGAGLVHVHCPPETQDVFVGAGEGPCVILCASSRQFQANGPWGYYTVDETARRHGACSDVETQDTEIAYANVPSSSPSRYREGDLPEQRSR